MRAIRDACGAEGGAGGAITNAKMINQYRGRDPQAETSVGIRFTHE